MNLGWVGLGVMGASMCAHLRRAGHDMTVYTRTRALAEEVLAAGAEWAGTPRAVAEVSDVVFTMVGFPRDVREVALGAGGALEGLRAGGILVDMTTSEPALAVEIAAAARAKRASRSWSAATRPRSTSSGRCSRCSDARSCITARRARGSTRRWSIRR